ncbi:MarR family transcriptional regulator [Streptomyces sp. BH055]|uniref:MarR family transcriptional regulator n=1 Tax=unclassified Streptomyces TaxID=2593676 RepID=UPI003BB71DBA
MFWTGSGTEVRRVVRGQDKEVSFLSNHARALSVIARNPVVRIRVIAAKCRITERSVQSIVADLEQAGYIRRHRVGRRTRYVLFLDQPPPHPAEAGLPVRALVELVGGDDVSQPPTAASASVTVA